MSIQAGAPECRAQELIQKLTVLHSRLVLAESCTGGLLAGVLTSIPGASRILWGSFVSYSPEAKETMLGIPHALISQEGMVSQSCLQAMLTGSLRHSPADLAIAVTGYAGPGGGFEAPVGTVWIGTRLRSGRMHMERFCFSGSREEVRKAAVAAALEMALLILDS